MHIDTSLHTKTPNNTFKNLTKTSNHYRAMNFRKPNQCLHGTSSLCRPCIAIKDNDQTCNYTLCTMHCFSSLCMPCKRPLKLSFVANGATAPTFLCNLLHNSQKSSTFAHSIYLNNNAFADTQIKNPPCTSYRSQLGVYRQYHD